MTAIFDLADVEVEHLLGDTYGPLVKIRCSSGPSPTTDATGAGVILLGQVDPATARSIAAHLTEAAARAEYGPGAYPMAVPTPPVPPADGRSQP